MALPKLTSLKYELTVPSTGKTIEFRPYTVREEKILLMAKAESNSKAMVRATRDLIKSCTFDTVKVEELTMFDFEYMFLKIRAASVGETSDIRIKCSSCDEYNDISINVDNAEVKGDIKRDMKVQINDEVGILMRYPMFDMANKVQDTQSAESMIKIIIECIESIYDADNVYPISEHNPKEVLEFVESIPSTKFREIAAKIGDAPAVALDADFKCMKCGHMNEVELKGLSSFF